MADLLAPILTAHRVLVECASSGDLPVFYDNRQFPWVRSVESQWREIRNDLDHVLASPSGVPAFHDISPRQAGISEERWRTVFFYIYGNPIRESLRMCPHTARALRSIPGLRTAMFSILEPGMEIGRHRGPFKGVLRFHLGLRVPRERHACALRVAGITRHWEEGRGFIFDDTFQHEAWNQTGELRAILFVDFLRPLPLLVDRINRWAVYAIKHLSPDVRLALDNARQFARAATGATTVTGEVARP